MKKLLLILALFCPIIISGCAITPFISPIVAGVVYWKEGEASKYYNFDVDACYRSTKRALRDLELEITEDETTDDGYWVVADENDRFKINIEKAEQNITVVKIRINTFGDKPYAELIYKHIDVNLGIIEFDENGQPVKRRQIISNQ